MWFGILYFKQINRPKFYKWISQVRKKSNRKYLISIKNIRLLIVQNIANIIAIDIITLTYLRWCY